MSKLPTHSGFHDLFLKYTTLLVFEYTTESAVIIILILSLFCLSFLNWSCCGRDRMVDGFTTTCICTISDYHAKVVSSNHADDEVYSTQHYVIKLPPPRDLTTTIEMKYY